MKYRKSPLTSDIHKRGVSHLTSIRWLLAGAAFCALGLLQPGISSAQAVTYQNNSGGRTVCVAQPSGVSVVLQFDNAGRVLSVNSASACPQGSEPAPIGPNPSTNSGGPPAADGMSTSQSS